MEEGRGVGNRVVLVIYWVREGEGSDRDTCGVRRCWMIPGLSGQ